MIPSKAITSDSQAPFSSVGVLPSEKSCYQTLDANGQFGNDSVANLSQELTWFLLANSRWCLARIISAQSSSTSSANAF